MSSTSVNFCPHCGAGRSDGAFCGQCGSRFPVETAAPKAAPETSDAPAVPAPPVQSAPPARPVRSGQAERPVEPAPAAQQAPVPPATRPPADATWSGEGTGEATTRVEQATFAWPIPDRSVVVNGRATSAEVVVVAAVYGIGALWLAISLHSALSLLPDLVKALFGDGLDFFLAWLVLLVLTLLLYVVGLLGYTSYALLRCDPVGRGLSMVITATLFLLVFSDARTGTVVFLAILSAGCTLVLFASPWARRALDGERRHGRPWPVVLSQTLTLTFFSLTGLMGLAFVPGLRYADLIGVKIVLFVLLTIVGSAAALHGARLLIRSPDRTGRLLVTGAWLAVFLAEVLSGSGSGTLITLAILAGGAAPLWLAPSARNWFGDAPLGADSTVLGPPA